MTEKKDRMVNLHFMIRESDMKKLKEMASSADKGRSAIIRMLIRQGHFMWQMESKGLEQEEEDLELEKVDV